MTGVELSLGKSDGEISLFLKHFGFTGVVKLVEEGLCKNLEDLTGEAAQDKSDDSAAIVEAEETSLVISEGLQLELDRNEED